MRNSMLVKRFSTACIAVFLGVFVDCLTLRSLKCFQQSEKNVNIYIVLITIDSQYHARTGVTQPDQDIFNENITGDIVA